MLNAERGRAVGYALAYRVVCGCEHLNAKLPCPLYSGSQADRSAEV